MGKAHGVACQTRPTRARWMYNYLPELAQARREPRHLGFLSGTRTQTGRLRPDGEKLCLMSGSPWL